MTSGTIRQDTLFVNRYKYSNYRAYLNLQRYLGTHVQLINCVCSEISKNISETVSLLCVITV